jgi:mono/diheme cytochrome c family protein
VVTALVVAVAVVGCGEDGDDASGAAPPDGAALYADNCASCHGDDLRGTSMGPSQLSIVYEPGHHPDDAFRSAVREGVPEHHWDFGPMPAVPGLDDDEITAIIAHIRSVQAREGFEPYPPE